MNTKIVIISILVGVALLFASCNTYQRCPAYGAVEVEIVQDKV
jgi:hypothetical protein